MSDGETEGNAKTVTVRTKETENIEILPQRDRHRLKMRDQAKWRQR